MSWALRGVRCGAGPSLPEFVSFPLNLLSPRFHQATSTSCCACLGWQCHVSQKPCCPPAQGVIGSEAQPQKVEKALGKGKQR